jgi:DNA-binding MarR family transcriptional regulator
VSFAPPTTGPNRSEQVEYVSSQLLPRTALLTRLLVRQLRGELSRSEAGLLNTLRAGSRRVTELAELEGLAQPTMTLLVKRLEHQRLVTRKRQADDGRVVLVSLTDAGRTALDDFTAQASAALREYLAGTSDEQIQALADATETLETLVGALQQAGTSY